MASFDPSFPHTLAAELFARLRRSLEQLSSFGIEGETATDTFLLTEDSVSDAALESIDHFSLVISSSFAILLIASRQQDDYGVDLIVDNGTIVRFIDWLAQEAATGQLQTARRLAKAVQGDDGQRFAPLLLAALPSLGGSHEGIPATSLVEPSGAALPSAAPIETVAEPAAEGPVSSYQSLPLERHQHYRSRKGDRSLSAPPTADRRNASQAFRQQNAPNSQSALRELDASKVESAKNVFLATVNHELRTPLTYILGMSTTLLRWIDSGATVALQRQQRHYLESIYNQGKHLLTLINGILDLSQSELGQITLNLQPVSLSKLLQQCIRAYQADAHQQGIKLLLETQIHPAQDKIAADPLRLQQIVTNLLSNAIKFTPLGGQVTVGLSLTETEAVIEVRDTGIGIAEHHQAVIFQKFKQVDASYHRQYAGIGTGLALVKQLTELHHGQVEVSSTPGVGTVFTVRLPYSFCITSPFPEAVQPRVNGSLGGRVLLLDGGGDLAETIADGVLTAGYPLLWMLDRPHSLSQIMALEPSHLIVGGRFADGDGRSLIHQLRCHPGGEQLRIIAIDDGCEAVAEPHHRYSNLGVTAVLSAPIDLAALLDGLWGSSA
ncbi:MAG: HAMP domain-containing sensor histidine kinase [Cyanobacteria bacterium P01_A01_bin.135]